GVGLPLAGGVEVLEAVEALHPGPDVRPAGVDADADPLAADVVRGGDLAERGGDAADDPEQLELQAAGEGGGVVGGAGGGGVAAAGEDLGRDEAVEVDGGRGLDVGRLGRADPGAGAEAAGAGAVVDGQAVGRAVRQGGGGGEEVAAGAAPLRPAGRQRTDGGAV